MKFNLKYCGLVVLLGMIWLPCEAKNMAVVVDKALVICFPGKPSGAVECLGFVVGAIPHCVEVLQEVPTSC